MRKPSINNPTDGHRAETYRHNLGRSVIGGASGSFYGIRLRCECGFTSKANVAPSKGGLALMNEDYRAHLEGEFQER